MKWPVYTPGWGTMGWALLLALAGQAALAAKARDPFWPIGYEPPAPLEVKGSEPLVVGISWPELPVLGRSRAPDGSYRALLEGIGVVKEGDDVAISKDGFQFNWRIVKIDAKGLQSIRLGVVRQRTLANPEPIPAPPEEMQP